MLRGKVILLLALALVVSGCVTTPVVNYGPENQQLREKLSSAQSQVDKLKQENDFLKQQLEAARLSKQEVRMPNGAEIQAALKKAGYYKGPLDGQIGTQTKESIKKFQQANGINPDGVVGSKTWSALSKYLDKK